MINTLLNKQALLSDFIWIVNILFIFYMEAMNILDIFISGYLIETMKFDKSCLCVILD